MALRMVNQSMARCTCVCVCVCVRARASSADGPFSTHTYRACIIFEFLRVLRHTCIRTHSAGAEAPGFETPAPDLGMMPPSRRPCCVTELSGDDAGGGCNPAAGSREAKPTKRSKRGLDPARDGHAATKACGGNGARDAASAVRGGGAPGALGAVGVVCGGSPPGAPGASGAVRGGSAPGVVSAPPGAALAYAHGSSFATPPVAMKSNFQDAMDHLAVQIRLLDGLKSPSCRSGQPRGFIECFSGSGHLTQAWSEGSHTVFPMDISRGDEHDMHNVDVGGALLLKQCALMVRATGKKPVVHFAPPCCTYSAARYPKIRTKDYPHGLPANVLNPLEKKTLAYANRVTKNTCRIMTFLSELGIPVHFEQPHGSLMQRERCFRGWVASSGAAKCVVDYCCFGVPYRKRTAIWCSPPWLLDGLARQCPGDHEHTATLSNWGQKERNRATGAGSSAYPVQLCKAWRAAVLANLHPEAEP